jgi:hypothetical protein
MPSWGVVDVVVVLDADASDRLGTVVGGDGKGADGKGDDGEGGDGKGGDGMAPDGTVTGGVILTPPMVAVGVETVGVGIGFGALVIGVVRVGAGLSKPRRTPHFAFHSASVCRSLRSNPLGAAILVDDALVPLNECQASEASAVALNSLASATAYGCPWVPYVALPELLPGQRASAYCGCWKLPAAAVCPIGPVSAGLAVPWAKGALSTCVWDIE